MDRLALGVYTTSSAATVWYKLEHSGRADILLVEDVEQLDKVTMMELLSILNNFIQKGDQISFIVVDSMEKNSLQLLAPEVLTEAKKMYLPSIGMCRQEIVDNVLIVYRFISNGKYISYILLPYSFYDTIQSHCISLGKRFGILL